MIPKPKTETFILNDPFTLIVSGTLRCAARSSAVSGTLRVLPGKRHRDCAGYGVPDTLGTMIKVVAAGRQVRCLGVVGDIAAIVLEILGLADEMIKTLLVPETA